MADSDRPLIDLELVRTEEDRRTYALGDVGTVRLIGFWSRNGVATAGDRSWQLVRRSLWTTASVATDEGGADVGTFTPHTIRRGGTLTWAGRPYVLQPSSTFAERYALLDDGAEVATIAGRSWGRTRATLSLDPGHRLDPGLLLYVAFVVRALAEDASAAAGGSAAATVAATS